MYIDNNQNILRDVINDYIQKNDEIVIVTPFLSYSDILFKILEENLKVTVICRLSYPATPELFKKILPYLDEAKTFYVYDDDSLHAKIYLFKNKNKPMSCIIGSSNFTDNGLFENKEFNVAVNHELELVEKYINYLIENSYSVLNNEAIEYYESFYMYPSQNRRRRRAIISERDVSEYQEILNKFNYIKGLLEKENSAEIPFTYVFDGFCHIFKYKMRKELKLNPFKNFDKNEFKKYFKMYLDKYFSNKDFNSRKEKYNFNQEIRNNLIYIPPEKIRKFFLGIWSISYGSGSGRRKKAIKEIKVNLLKELLDFIINDKLSMPQKYSVALISRDKRGLKIPYLGPSAIGEIPGWLMPEFYPIKNDKFLYILKFFNILTQ